MNNTIMIVDDMKLNIDMLAEALGNKYNIMPVTSGDKAMRLLEHKKPDLVLLDVSMPGVDGFDVLKFMKSRKDLSGIPVIFITGEHDVCAEEKGLALGAVDYVKKPYSPSVVSVKVQNHLDLKAYRDNLEFIVNERTKQLAASREAVIMGMSLMSESHDSVTGEHIKRIKYYANLLANKMVEMYPDIIDTELCDKITLYSPLHDVGKISVSDTILCKTGLLTSEEFDIMKTHTVKGAELLKKTEQYLTDSGDYLRVAIEIAEYHHEKYDGTGYPHGLKGECIPISARIVSVADVYDALRSPRPYKKAFTHEESVDIITKGDNRTSKDHFDPKVLEAFMAVQDSFNKVMYTSCDI